MTEGREEIYLVVALVAKLFSRKPFQEQLDIVRKCRRPRKPASLQHNEKKDSYQTWGDYITDRLRLLAICSITVKQKHNVMDYGYTKK